MTYPFSRRHFLAVSGAAAAALAVGACGDSSSKTIGPSNAAVAEAERRRRTTGAKIRDFDLVPGEMMLDLGGRMVKTWGYNERVPGPEIRVAKGEIIRAKITNRLPESTSIHWHGLALRNDMDGVPGVTQKEIKSGEAYTYEFAVPDAGTFWFHPHSGLQLDRGLYAPLIVDDPAEPGRYDKEIVVVLDDWTDGIGESPDAIFRRLTGSTGGMGGMGGMSGMDTSGSGTAPATTPTAMPMAMSDLLGGDAGDVMYPLFLLNGRPPTAPPTFDAKPGDRVRIRLINAGADTVFRVAVGGHRLTVTHTDGFPTAPLTVDTLLLAMGERYDVTITMTGAGVFPLVALAEGKGAQAMGVIRTGSGSAPAADARPAELDGQLLKLADLRPAASVALKPATPVRSHQLVLGVDSDRYRWTINGRTFGKHVPLPIVQGERVRLVFDNQTTMFHPMHLHGHTFQVVGANDAPGARKDTVIVMPNEKIAVDFDGDNPGQWVIHCHNTYHMETGMMTTLSYTK